MVDGNIHTHTTFTRTDACGSAEQQHQQQHPATRATAGISCPPTFARAPTDLLMPGTAAGAAGAALPDHLAHPSPYPTLQIHPLPCSPLPSPSVHIHMDKSTSTSTSQIHTPTSKPGAWGLAAATAAGGQSSMPWHTYPYPPGMAWHGMSCCLCFYFCFSATDTAAAAFLSRVGEP